MAAYRTAVTIALALAAVALVSVGLVTTRRISRLSDDARLVEHTQEVIAQVQRVLALGVDAETGVRGFAITGEDAFLEPYNESRARMGEEVTRLQTLARDNPGQESRARELADALARRTGLLAAVIEVRRRRGFEAARQLVSTQEGKRLMDRVRVVADDMIRGEQSLLAERKRLSAAGFERTGLVAFIATVGTGLALMLAAIQMRTELQKRQAAETSVRSAYEAVEEKIKARTRELERALELLQVREDELKDALATRALALTVAQQAQRESETANQLKDEFLATASHELRTPLNAIIGWAHVLKLPAVTDDQRSHAVDAIERNAKVQTRLIEDLLDVSGMIQGRLNIVVSSVDLRTAVQEAIVTVSPAAHARDVRLDVQLGDEAVIIDGDPSRLQQVAWNLLSNAVKFTAKGGEVRVRVDGMGGRARLCVDDSGEGIDPAFLPHVFDAFRQGPGATMRSGLGLGLAIVRRLVELHGGTITADSPGRGQGASFVATFPLHLGATVSSGGERVAGLAGVKVLIAEDDDDSAAALTAVLRLLGCQVRTARTASECLRMLGDWHPDVLLCDVGLPDDDGYSLLRRARSAPGYGETPAIALTAFAGESDRVRALAAGFKAHIPKPFDPDIVVREIRSAIPSHT
jgi:signal transduction histidine kinase